jgi:hypothetical protein
VADDLFLGTSRELRQIIARQLRHLMERPRSYRTLVIAALGIRASRLNKALFILTASSLREEANALLRILIEVVVNGAYLMVSSEKEFNAFVAFPVVALGKHHRAYLAHTNVQSTFTEDFNQLVAANAAEAELMSGRTPKDSSWTTESVYKRAVAADAVFKHGILPDLAATAYAGAHDYIHGNFPAVLDSLSALQGEMPAPEDIQTDENAMLSAATMALLGYAPSLEAHFQMGCKQDLQHIVLSFAKAETQ